MAWGGKDENGDPGKPGLRLAEWQMWAACLMAAAMPTVVVTSIIQVVEGKTAPAFVPALYIGLFTIMVLIVRPWSDR